MRRLIFGFGLVSLLVLAACAVRPSTGGLPALPGNAAGESISTGVVSANPAGQPAQVEEVGTGTLRIAIKWPDRDLPGFKAATIPATTRALGFKLVNGGVPPVTLLDSIVPRQAGATQSVTFDKVKAGGNLSLSVTAYRNLDAGSGGVSEPIASGTQGGITIVRSQFANVNIVLNATFAPAISGFDANVGLTQATIKINGSNLGSVEGTNPVVRFGGGFVASVTSANANQLIVTVPAGSVTGPIEVVSDGMKVLNPPTFFVVSNLEIGAPKEAWDAGPASNRKVLVGGTLQFQATPSYLLANGDSISNYTPPALSWAEDGAGSIAADGKLTAPSGTGAFTVSAALGAVRSASASVSAVDVVVNASLDKTEIGVASVTDSAKVVFSSVLSDGQALDSSLVFVSTPDNASLSIRSDGSINIINGAAYGIATIKVESTLAASKNKTLNLTLTNYLVSNFAGNGQAGPQTGTGVNGRFEEPRQMVFLNGGTILVADSKNNQLRVVSPVNGLGSVAIHCGSISPPPGNSGQTDGQCAGAATFNNPIGVGFLAPNIQIVADTGNNSIRKTETGNVTVITGQAGSGLLNGTIANAKFSGPSAIVVNNNSEAFISDELNHTIRKLDRGFVNVTSLIGKTSGPGEAGFIDDVENLARVNRPTGLGMDASGNLLIADAGNHSIRKWYAAAANGKPAGWVATIAGLGSSNSGHLDGPANVAKFSEPNGVAQGADDYLFVTDTNNNCIRRVGPDGFVKTIAGSTTAGYTDGAGSTARFRNPTGILVDADGIIYVADTMNHSIRKIVKVP